MEFKFTFTKQPAARSMVARTISAPDMLRMTIAKLHAANAQNDRLTGELAAANQRIKVMQQRNELLWDSYQDLRSTLNRTEAAKNAIEANIASGSAISSTPLNLGGIGQTVEANNDCANLTDSRIAELLQEIDQAAIDFGSLGFGLPMHVPAIKAKMFETVRMWLAKNGE